MEHARAKERAQLDSPENDHRDDGVDHDEAKCQQAQLLAHVEPADKPGGQAAHGDNNNNQVSNSKCASDYACMGAPPPPPMDGGNNAWGQQQRICFKVCGR